MNDTTPEEKMRERSAQRESKERRIADGHAAADVSDLIALIGRIDGSPIECSRSYEVGESPEYRP